jgi:hypothetical protein
MKHPILGDITQDNGNADGIARVSHGHRTIKICIVADEIPFEDNLDKIAKSQGSTTEILKKLDPAAVVLQLRQVLQFQKAFVQRVITGWRVLTSDLLQMRYNGRGDSSCSKKIDDALGLVRQGQAAVCTN